MRRNYTRKKTVNILLEKLIIPFLKNLTIVLQSKIVITHLAHY